MNPYAIQINIDGSCYKNPGGNGGCAGILEFPDEEGIVIFKQGYEPTTNNRMELMAFLTALRYIKAQKHTFKAKGCNAVEIYTDSENTLMSYRNVETWRTAGWVGQHGNPISNVDLLKELVTLKTSVGFSYKPYHIQNKSTPVSKEVDRLAKQAAKGDFRKRDTGYIAPKVSRTKTRGGTDPFVVEGQKEVIRVFGHGLVSHRVDTRKVKFEVMRDGAIEKYYAYVTGDTDKLIHRHHFYLAQFNSEEKNPMIIAIEDVDEEEVSAQWE